MLHSWVEPGEIRVKLKYTFQIILVVTSCFLTQNRARKVRLLHISLRPTVFYKYISPNMPRRKRYGLKSSGNAFKAKMLRLENILVNEGPYCMTQGEV